MGAPRGNKNAAGPHKKGRYKKGGSRMALYHAKSYNQRMKFFDKIFTSSYRDWETDRKSTRLNSSHRSLSRMPSSA